MLKMKNLVDNRELAIYLLGNWDYDSNQLDILNHFRISSNAVYSFFCNDNVNFLRFAPVEEKEPFSVQAELEFLRYLKTNGYNSVETVVSKNGEEFVVTKTPWGSYIATVFKGAPGKQLSQIEYSDALYFGYGEALGKLHSMSKHYTPNIRRRDWKENLDWADKILKECDAPEKAFEEVLIIKNFFSNLPMTPDNYGLVHYDFELDNVFFDSESGLYTPIDFDDSMYNWFVVDIEQSLESIKDELDNQYHDNATKKFIDGYRLKIDVDESLLGIMPLFKRFVDLFGYTRCLHCIHEPIEHEEEWMPPLKEQLEISMVKRSENFGKEIYI